MDIFISKNIMIFREKCGYTQETLSELLGVSRQTVAKWERGETYPDIVNCLKLSKLFKLTLDQLVSVELTAASVSADESEGRVFGLLDISEEGAIKLPESLLSIFGITTDDKLILLADKSKGIALVKCDQ